jgi:nitrogen fixation/metabolism regulation signal transduction histidine kinase
MASDRSGPEPLGPSPLVLRLSAGAALVGLLAWLLIELVTRTHFYATATLVAGALLMTVQGLARAIARIDQGLADAVDALVGGSSDGVPRAARGFPALARVMEKTAGRLRREGQSGQAERDALRALLDTVPAALLVLGPDGQVELANRAAFALARSDVRRLDELSALGPEAVQALQSLPPGGRMVVRAEGGRKLFASCSRLSRPPAPPVSLIALQTVTEDLGVVEQQAWGELIRVLAHEMMNSLTPIASMSESLARRTSGVVDGEARAAIEVIARRSANLMAFVDGYRAMAEVPRPVLTPVRIGAMAEDIAQLMAASLQAAGAALAIEVVPADLEAPADPALLEQAVINLVKNALDAVSGRPCPAIALTARAAADRVLITVADNGEGVPPDRREAIFVPFYTSRIGGSGIGLSLARQIALAHNGQLTVQGGEPCGAVFEISLPAGTGRGDGRITEIDATVASDTAGDGPP